MLEINNLTFRYGRRLPIVLDGLKLTLGDGEIGVLLGKNGAGKSTLFKILTGLERPSSGSIVLNGCNLPAMSPRERAKQVAYVPQSVTFGDLSVFDTVLTGRLAHFGLSAGEDDREVVNKILEEMGLADFAERSADRLSGGEKQKVAIARAIVGNPSLIVFDEPTGNLDLANEMLLICEMKKLAKERGITILCSLHDIYEAKELGDRFFFMKNGVVAHAGGKDIFTEDVIEDVFGVRINITGRNIL